VNPESGEFNPRSRGCTQALLLNPSTSAVALRFEDLRLGVASEIPSRVNLIQV
jgi:hypothetical protein